jgi:thioredoxin-like negative regulator of GroEL
MRTCAPCKAFKPVLQQTAAQLGVAINYVDVDTQGSMAQQYNVNSVPTLIIIDDTTNQIKHRSSGAMSASQLTSVLSMAK